MGRQHADGVREAARRAHAPRQAARHGRKAAGAGEVTRCGCGGGSAADGQIRPGKARRSHGGRPADEWRALVGRHSALTIDRFPPALSWKPQGGAPDRCCRRAILQRGSKVVCSRGRTCPFRRLARRRCSRLLGRPRAHLQNCRQTDGKLTSVGDALAALA